MEVTRRLEKQDQKRTQNLDTSWGPRKSRTRSGVLSGLGSQRRSAGHSEVVPPEGALTGPPWSQDHSGQGKSGHLDLWPSDTAHGGDGNCPKENQGVVTKGRKGDIELQINYQCP